MGPFFVLIFLHLGCLFWSLFRPHFLHFWVSLLVPFFVSSFLILGAHVGPVFRPHFPDFEGPALLLVSSTGSSSRMSKGPLIAATTDRQRYWSCLDHTADTQTLRDRT